jgi:hypothetical protein
MRKALFTVPNSFMLQFCKDMIHRGLTGEVTDITEEDEFIFEVSYQKPDNQSVNELEGHLAALTGELIPNQVEEEETED